MKQEYIIVRDENGEAVARKPVTSKVLAGNVHGYIINGSLVYGIKEYEIMQEEANSIPDSEEN